MHECTFDRRQPFLAAGILRLRHARSPRGSDVAQEARPTFLEGPHGLPFYALLHLRGPDALKPKLSASSALDSAEYIEKNGYLFLNQKVLIMQNLKSLA